jgi:hypothetical protein
MSISWFKGHLMDNGYLLIYIEIKEYLFPLNVIQIKFIH